MGRAGKRNRVQGDQGAVATEYAVLLGFLVLIIVMSITAFGGALNTFLQSLADAIQLLLGG